MTNPPELPRCDCFETGYIHRNNCPAENVTWEKRLEQSDAAKAVIALSKIIDFNHVTDDSRAVAAIHVEAYQKQKEVEYVRYLQEKIEKLQDALASERKKWEAEILAGERKRCEGIIEKYLLMGYRRSEVKDC